MTTYDVWQHNISDDEYNALSLEQQEFVDFIWKMDYEGGLDGLFGHSGTMYFPQRLKALAERAYELVRQLDTETNALGKELGIEF